MELFNRIKDGAWLKSRCVYNLEFRKLSNLGFVQFLAMFYLQQVSDIALSEINFLDNLCNSKSEISNVCNVVEGHFHWLISEHQSVNPSREAICRPSAKYKKFTFVHPVSQQ